MSLVRHHHGRHPGPRHGQLAKATLEPFILQPHAIDLGPDGLAELLLHLGLGVLLVMAAPSPWSSPCRWPAR